MLGIAGIGWAVGVLSLMTLAGVAPVAAQTANTPDQSDTGTGAATGGGNTATAPTPPPAPQRSHRWLPLIGVDVNDYIPSSSTVRNRFGSSAFSFGLGFGGVDIKRGGAITFDLQSVVESSGDNYFYAIPFGIGYYRNLVERQYIKPFVGVSADYVIVPLRDVTDGLAGGVRTTVGGSVSLGVSFGRTYYLRARYLGMGDVDNLNLSGFSFGGGVRF